jgi:membrane protein DedA with SNARE-associated domain
MKGEVFQERDNLRMEYLMQLIDFILHVDRYLEMFVANYGPWVYALLFLIVFVETGLVVMPFLPGDSLLFVVGTLCGTGLLSLPVAMSLLLIAAILGDQVNYRIGRFFSTGQLLTRRTIFTKPMVASPLFWRASCPL